MLKPRVKPWVMALNGRKPCKGETIDLIRNDCSIPRIAFVHRLAVLLADTTKLGLKIFLLVMLRLCADVITNRLHMNRADAEFAVAPCQAKSAYQESSVFNQPEDDDFTCSTIFAGA